MSKACRAGLPVVCVSAMLMLACQTDSHSPPSRPEPPATEPTDGALLAPIDLVYVCGNKFLATNQTRSAVQVAYRVVGSGETGSLTLRPASMEDEGHSETELQTVERGVVELYRDDELVARRRNQGHTCGLAPSFSSFAVTSTSASAGEWSAPFTWDNIAVHLSLLPTGKVLSWGLSGTPQVWDPAAGSFSAIPSPTEIFCAGHSLLSDGRVLITGGNNHPDIALNGIPDVTIFTPGTQSLARSSPMRYARWYPTTITLGNGDVVILSGKDAEGVLVLQPEVWSSGATRVLTASLSLPLYPRAFLAPNGKVFVAEKPASRYLDPSGNGSWTSVANRLYGQRDYGIGVMYEPGKVLVAGGGRTTNTAEIIDLNSAAPAWKWTGSMAFARRHHNAILLPTGEVLVLGGTSGTTFNAPSEAVHVAEIWNPSTEVWSRLASHAIPRVYHSTAVLLPDGRVLHTGSGDAGPDQRNAELFSPPYLFKGARPGITWAPEGVAYGSSFIVETPQAAEIAKVSLIRLGSTTHAFDMNQRFQWLSFQPEGGRLSVGAPSNSNHAPPGHYMLFLLNGNGVPSVGKIIQLGSTAPQAPPPNAAPTAAFTQSCDGLTCSFTDASTDSDGSVASWTWEFGDGASATGQNPSHTYGAEGSYDVTLSITDDDQAPATVTTTVTITPPAPNAAPTAGFSQTCTGLTCAFTDGSTDADGTVAGWSWDFGDGGSATTQSPSHTFAAEGSYEVTLAITDNDDAPATVTKTVTVTPPPPNSAPAAAFSQTCSGLTCTFTDGSTDGDGAVVSWHWNFGDGGSGTTQNPSHVYAAGGTYTVTLQVTDDAGGSAVTSASVTVVAPAVNAAPVADFTYSCTGLTCRFSDRSTDSDGTITAWKWAFGGGMSGTAQNPMRTYSTAGTYTVTLRVTDDDGATNQVAKSITVSSSSAPRAAFITSCAALACRFTDRSTDADGTLAAWRWTFGNGTSSTNRNPSRTYGSSGTYTVTLQVTDNSGATGQSSAAITVTSAIKLSVSGRVDATKQYMTLSWSGARGTTVDIYRNKTFLRQEANDGKYINTRALPGSSQYTYKVCELGSTTICSNEATVVF